MSKKLVFALLGAATACAGAVIGHKIYQEIKSMDETDYEEFVQVFGFGKNSMEKIKSVPCPFERKNKKDKEQTVNVAVKGNKIEKNDVEQFDEKLDTASDSRKNNEIDTVEEVEEVLEDKGTKECTYGCGCDGGCVNCVEPERCKTQDLKNNTDYCNNESKGPVPEEVIKLQQRMIDDLVTEHGTERNVYRPEYFKSIADANAYEELLSRCEGDEKRLFDALTTLFGTLGNVQYSKLL